MTDPNWSLARKMSRLTTRARVLAMIRAFFTAQGYLEVETPHRIPANAPEPHIDPVASGDWVLHTSPELAMKRMLAAGYERVFQICRVWRDGEHGQYHLPEFTLLEWYRTGSDYRTLMTECTALLQSLVPEGRLKRSGREIDLASPWQKLTVSEAFARYASTPLDEALATGCFEEILCDEVEPYLGRERPTFLHEYPAPLAALARPKPGNPAIAERFELYVDGMELANAFSELTDTDEQRRRFERDEQQRRDAGKPPYPLPARFLAELSRMPDAAGIALGVDRLIMLLTEADHIDEVVAYSADQL